MWRGSGASFGLAQGNLYVEVMTSIWRLSDYGLPITRHTSSASADETAGAPHRARMYARATAEVREPEMDPTTAPSASAARSRNEAKPYLMQGRCERMRKMRVSFVAGA